MTKNISYGVIKSRNTVHDDSKTIEENLEECSHFCKCLQKILVINMFLGAFFIFQQI
jgi:hypothetical protein